MWSVPRSKENFVIKIYQSGKGYKAISKVLGCQWTATNGAPNGEKPGTVVKLSWSGLTKFLQEGIDGSSRTSQKDLLALLAVGMDSFYDVTVRKTVSTAHQEDHKDASNICQPPKAFRIMFCELMSRKWTFLDDMSPVTSSVQLTQRSRIKTVKHGGGSVIV